MVKTTITSTKKHTTTISTYLTSSFQEQATRLDFIRKVYAILFTQLVITFGIISIFVWVPVVNGFVFQNRWLVWVFIVITFFMIIGLSFVTSLRREPPYNYLALLAFTVCLGCLLGCISVAYQGREIAIAVAATAVISLALTLFAFQTTLDFTMLGGVLLVGLLVLLMFSLMAIVFPSKLLRSFVTCFVVLLFSVYLIFDTQLMMGGKHQYAICSKDYTFAALNLYLDVVNLFLAMLGMDFD